MCLPKEKIGLRFRAIHEFNLALLVKNLLKEKYFKHSLPLKTTSCNNPSNTWTSIVTLKDLLSLNIWKNVHFGNEIRAWEVPWILTIPDRPAREITHVVHPMTPISDLILG